VGHRSWGSCFEGHAAVGSLCTIGVGIVVVGVRYCVGYCHPEPVVVVVLIVICYKGYAMLRVVYLQNSDAILEWVL